MPAQSNVTPPRGFQISTSETGERSIRYRTSGMWHLMAFFGVFLAIWLQGFISIIRHIINNGVDYVALAVVPMALAGVGAASYASWFFCSVTSFAFGPSTLRVERSLLWYCRRQTFNKNEIEAIKQVKDGGEDEDSFPTWGLEIIANTSAVILSRQPIDKSNWLGPFIAQWADVRFEPAQPWD
jgi:hypothetical protein